MNTQTHVHCGVEAENTVDYGWAKEVTPKTIVLRGAREELVLTRSSMSSALLMGSSNKKCRKTPKSPSL